MSKLVITAKLLVAISLLCTVDGKAAAKKELELVDDHGIPDSGNYKEWGFSTVSNRIYDTIDRGSKDVRLFFFFFLFLFSERCLGCLSFLLASLLLVCCF